MQLAPIALFVYNRPWHLRQTVDSLMKNCLVKESELIIFSDAPKDKKAEAGVKAVREYLETIAGFKNVLIHNRKDNLSPARNIIYGVTEVLNEYGKVIVLEDDLCVSQYFLNFMNDALLFYENEPKVISICGYMYPVKTKNCETFFLRLPDSWGWATWKRGWDLFELNANNLLEGLKAGKLIRKFDLNGGYGYSNMLKRQVGGKFSSWAICWYAVSLLNDKLSLYPSKSLVRNIGFDDSGINCGYGAGFAVDTFQGKINILNIPLQENQDAIREIGIFLRIEKVKKLGYFIRKALARDFKRDRISQTVKL